MCSLGFSPVAPVSLTAMYKHVHQVFLQSVPLTKELASGVGIWSWSPGAVLWLPTAPQGWVKCSEQISLYIVYM